MFREIKIGDKTVPMLAVASVNIYCKRVFGIDPLRAVNSEMETAEGIDLYQKVGFIMAKLAACNAAGSFAHMAELNEDSYLEWLCGLDNGALIDATQQIAQMYIGQQNSTSTVKNT